MFFLLLLLLSVHGAKKRISRHPVVFHLLLSDWLAAAFFPWPTHESGSTDIYRCCEMVQTFITKKKKKKKRKLT
jgi:hypothetical protein